MSEVNASEAKEVNEQVVQSMKDCIAELAPMLEKRLPDIKNQCGRINAYLRQEPAAAALLTPDEIGVFMNSHYHLAEIEWTAPKSAKVEGKLKEMSKKVDLDLDGIQL